MILTHRFPQKFILPLPTALLLLGVNHLDGKTLKNSIASSLLRTFQVPIHNPLNKTLYLTKVALSSLRNYPLSFVDEENLVEQFYFIFLSAMDLFHSRVSLLHLPLVPYKFRISSVQQERVGNSSGTNPLCTNLCKTCKLQLKNQSLMKQLHFNLQYPLQIVQ